MKDIKVPGVVWAILIIIAVAVIHENEIAIQNWLGIDPYILDIGIGMLVALLKTLSLGTEEQERALDIIDRLLMPKDVSPTGMRAAQPAEENLIIVEAIPKRPNPVMRWLFG